MNVPFSQTGWKQNHLATLRAEQHVRWIVRVEHLLKIAIGFVLGVIFTHYIYL